MTSFCSRIMRTASLGLALLLGFSAQPVADEVQVAKNAAWVCFVKQARSRDTSVRVDALVDVVMDRCGSSAVNYLNALIEAGARQDEAAEMVGGDLAEIIDAVIDGRELQAKRWSEVCRNVEFFFCLVAYGHEDRVSPLWVMLATGGWQVMLGNTRHTAGSMVAFQVDALPVVSWHADAEMPERTADQIIRQMASGRWVRVEWQDAEAGRQFIAMPWKASARA